MIKNALILPKGEETFWWQTAVALMKGKEAEILAEKGNRQILDVIREAKQARDKKWTEKADKEEEDDVDSKSGRL